MSTEPSAAATSAHRPVLSTSGLVLAARRIGYLPLLAMAALLATDLVVRGIGEGWLGFDLRGTLWDPAVAIREGRSPYPAAVASEVEVGNPALYPPFLMLLVTPLTVLPWSLGATLWTALLVGAVVGTLYALDVRDLRCYAIALLSLPVVTGVLWGNAGVLLLAAVALAWRWREQWLRTGVLVGLAIAAKLFLWPLLPWLLGTRRYRAAGAALGAAAVGILVPWAAIGFDGFTAYPDLLRVAEDFYAVHGYSVATMAGALGAATELATSLALALGALLALGVFLVARRGHDDVAVSLAVVVAILASPIVWEYYYVLLFVPLAILRPRFSALWLLPLLLYATHRLPRPKLPARELEPGGSACCKPDGVPGASWVFNHAPPGLWPALGHALVALSVVALAVLVSSRQQRSDEAPGRPA